MENIVSVSETEEASLLVIAGDLFDQNIEAETMRQDLRKILGGANLKTIILPGNHDYQSYRSGLYFGDNVYVLNDWATPFDFGEVSIWGLPFDKLEGDRLAGRLQEMGRLMDKQRRNLLLFHGELLDAFYSARDMGEEGSRRYMPAHLSSFSALPVEYVLAGHFHSGYKGWEIGKERLFIYPGSPVSITSRETGRRVANLIINNQRPLEIALDTFHYEDLTIELDPFSSENPLLKLEKSIQQLHPSARLLIEVRGLFDGSRLGLSESELAAGIQNIAGAKLARAVVETFTDVRHVLEDDLFKAFLARLEMQDYADWQKAKVRELAIKAFRVVKACS